MRTRLRVCVDVRVVFLEISTTAAVHEAATRLGFTLKKEQERAISAFVHGHVVFSSLANGFWKEHLLISCLAAYAIQKNTNV